MKYLFLGLVVSSLVACAAGPRVRVRGWVGGEGVPVTRATAWSPPRAGPERVVGMPAALDADRGVLLTRVAADSPLARAGVREGDLVLSVDGRPVGEPVELREEIEAKSPGTTTALSVWRDGRTTEKIVMVGREEYEKRGVLRIGLFVSPTLDLWPFDDGFDVLGIVGAHWYTRPAELSSPPREWLARALPDRNLPAPVVRSTAFFVLPVGVAVQTRTLAQHR